MSLTYIYTEKNFKGSDHGWLMIHGMDWQVNNLLVIPVVAMRRTSLSYLQLFRWK